MSEPRRSSVSSTRIREWALILALVLVVALVLWQGRSTEKTLTRLEAQLDAKEQARIDLLEARVIVLEKNVAELKAKED